MHRPLAFDSKVCEQVPDKREDTSIKSSKNRQAFQPSSIPRSRLKGSFPYYELVKKDSKMSYCIPSQVTEIRLIYQNKVKAANRPQVKSSLDGYKIFNAKWSDQIGFIEEFYILLLDRSNRAMGHYLVSQGGMAGTVVDAKVVFAAALKGRASCIVLAHNHPSGNLKPSQADLDLTKKLRQVGNLLDLPVLDHLILSPEGGYYSFADEGIF